MVGVFKMKEIAAGVFAFDANALKVKVSEIGTVYLREAGGAFSSS